jgi:hypothetical protein
VAKTGLGLHGLRFVNDGLYPKIPMNRLDQGPRGSQAGDPSSHSGPLAKTNQASNAAMISSEMSALW